MANERFSNVTHGRVFTARLSDGNNTASVNLDLTELANTRRDALTALAKTLREMANEVQDLAVKARS